MSKSKAGAQSITGVTSLVAPSTIPEKKTNVVDLFPHLNKATPEVRKCVDDFYHQYSMAVPQDWIVLQRAKEDYKSVLKYSSTIHMDTWIGLADYLNAREGIDLVRGDSPKYYAYSLVLYYILNEWMPNHGFDQQECYRKYSVAVADYIEFSCHRMPPYPARTSHGQVMQFFQHDIYYFMRKPPEKPTAVDYLTPWQLEWTEEQRKADEERREQVIKILVEGYGQVQKEIQRSKIRWETFKALFYTLGLPILVGILAGILATILEI